jgi:carbamoyl-phosphate synthase large subunit
MMLPMSQGECTKPINVLITSVSKKVWLVKLFKTALKGLGIEGKVISVDIDPLSAGFFVSDKHYIVPSTSSETFIPEILGICRREHIRLLIPTRDGELTLFAENKSLFESEGITILVSDKDVIETCRDKYLFWEFLEHNGFESPKTFLPNQADFTLLKYPLIVKPRSGSGGKSAFKIANEEELRFFQKYVPNAIIQEFVKGREYTVDVLSDFEGNVLTIVPRERIEVINGESSKGRTLKHDGIMECTKELVEALGTKGHVTIQCIIDGDRIAFIEVNPRFGGGAALGIAAGANTPAMILRLLNNERVKPMIGQFKEGLIMLRYTDDFFVDEKGLRYDQSRSF